MRAARWSATISARPTRTAARSSRSRGCCSGDSAPIIDPRPRGGGGAGLGLRRLGSLTLAVGLALGLFGTVDRSVEAAVLRAKITWQFETGDAGCPATVKDRA